MEEPPAKRPRRALDTISPRSPRPHEERSSRRHEDDRNGYSNDPLHRKDRDEDNDRKHRRSRSPPREKHPSRRDRSRDRDRAYRDRPRSRDRHRDRDSERSRRDGREHRSRRHSRSRSRSPPRNVAGVKRARSRSRTDHERRDALRSKPEPNTNGIKMEAMGYDPDDPEAYMKAVMGFVGFRSTKNTKVPGNQWYGVRKEKKTEYRQYMNRVGGFNRPLSPSR